jgi:hypothetical protein
MHRATVICTALALLAATALADDVLGQRSTHPYPTASTGNRYDAANPYDADSIHNPYGQYSGEYKHRLTIHPYITDAQRLYDDDWTDVGEPVEE